LTEGGDDSRRTFQLTFRIEETPVKNLNQQRMSDAQEDPYETLGLPRNATQAQIKTAYRKLALRFHPDKQSNEEDRNRCSDKFTKIGNAYEILGDPERRAEYDRFGTTGAGSAGYHQQQQQQQYHQDPFMSGGFFGGFGRDPFMNDPFFGGNNNGRAGGFMDPFDLFRNVFGDELNGSFNGPNNANRGAHGSFGGMNSHDMMSRHMNMMNSMMNMHSSFPSGMNMDQGGGGHYSYSSSTSSSFGNGGNVGPRESVTTSTRIINGKRQTITERTVVKPDGTIERTTETSGDDDFPAALDYNGQQQNGQLMQNSSSDQQRQRGGFFRPNR